MAAFASAVKVWCDMFVVCVYSSVVRLQPQLIAEGPSYNVVKSWQVLRKSRQSNPVSASIGTGK